jgi:hypothetical protein
MSRKLVRDGGIHTSAELAELARLYDLFGLMEDDEEILRGAE